MTAIPQFSSSLSGWQDASGAPQVLTSEGGVEILSMEVPEILRASGKLFFRLRIESAE